MVFNLYPKSDATIYEKHFLRNTGVDPILEISKITPNTKDPDGGYWENFWNSRILMKFDINQLKSLINNGKISSNATYYLNLKATEASDLPVEFTLKSFIVSKDWENGDGNYNDFPEVRTGVNWTYTNGYYQGSGTLWETSSFTSGTTGSWIANPGGGNWYTGSQYTGSQIFDFGNPDLRMDITNIVNSWVNNVFPNYGLILKRDTSDEFSVSKLGSIKFFGRETHTIFMPRLEAVWDDSDLTYSSSFSEIDLENYALSIKNIRSEYREAEIVSFKLHVRDRFPVKTYSTSSNYFVGKRLPLISCYAIRDAHTYDYIIPFDTGSTRISIGSSGNHFKVNMNSFMPERYYEIMIKSITSDGYEDIYEDTFKFKVVK